MPERSKDWMRQAEADLRHAAKAVETGAYEWACFAAQQAAEKAVKAVFIRHHRDAWGHTVSVLLGELADLLTVSPELVEKAKVLDKHYIPTRYPNGFETGAPTDFYTRGEAETAVRLAEEIIEFCKSHLG